MTDFVQSTTYAYTYDGINRLTAARATGVTGQTNLGNATYTYDKIGNLQSLKRHILENNAVQQQNYNYVYQPNTNRLLKVESGANRYTYDENGNMISDTKKNLNNTIYGRANLPSRLEMTSNTTTYIYDANDMRIYKKVDSVETVLKEEYYLRDATGRELAVIDNNYNINWYIYGKERVASMQHEMPVGLEKLFITSDIPDGVHYAAESIKTDGSVQPSNDVTLEAGDKVSMLPGFSVPAGAKFNADIKKPDGIPNFIYYLYDHLGNTRVTYSVKMKASNQIDYTVESASDYYPYGKALRSYGKERYQSTYHERDLESGFDYRGARFYDSDVARFNSLDPLAAEFPEWSDYNYVLGNPNSYTDPDGRTPILGAIIGAAIDYGVQVTVNVIKDGLSTEAFTSDVNWTSVVVSGGAGATGVGIVNQVRKLSKVKNLSKIGKGAIQVTTDAAISTTSQAVVDGEVKVGNVISDVAIGHAARGTVGKIVKNKAVDSKTGKQLQNEINRQKNIARGKSRASGVKRSSADVGQAQESLDSFTSTQAALGSATAAGSVRKSVNELKNDKKNEND